MKKQALRILSLLLCAMLLVSPLTETARAVDGVEINADNFPCGNFRKFVKQYDLNTDNALSDDELAAIETMDCSDKAITSLTGIGYFTSLTSLDCSFNELTALDLSENPLITKLACYYNELASLNISALSELTELDCHGNYGMGTLSLANNTALQILNCSGSSLSALDVSALTELTELNCSQNDLTSLSLAGKVNMTTLDCSSNSELAALDVSGCTALTTLDFSWCAVATPALGGCTALEYLDCSYNAITGSALDVSSLAALTELRCYGNELTSLTLAGNPALTKVDCAYNAIESLDVSSNTALKTLWANSNALTSVNTGTIGVEELELESNQLTTLTLTNAALTRLVCSYNNLTELNISGCPSLTYLDCTFNNLTGLNILSCPELVLAAEEGEIQNYGNVLYFQYTSGSHECYLWVDPDVAVTGAEMPAIDVQPEDVTVYNGETASFTVEATGGGLRYQWYYRTSPKKAWKKISGKTASTHTVKSTASRNGYQYRCKITNRIGSVYTEPATLTVIKFFISSQPTDATVEAGKKAVFTVKAKGSSLKYQWYYLAPGGEWTKYKNKTAATLKFTAKEEKDGYMYRCRIKSGKNVLISDEVTLTVAGA